MYKIIRKSWWCFYHEESDVIWENRLFKNTYLAIEELDLFFGVKNSYLAIKDKGWKLRPIESIFRIRQPKSRKDDEKETNH